jgi:hypothetical protein
LTTSSKLMICCYMRQQCCATNIPTPLFGHYERSLAWSCGGSKCSMPSVSQTRCTAYPRRCWTIQHTTQNCRPVTSLCFAPKKALKGGRLGSEVFRSNPVSFLCCCVNGMAAFSSLYPFLTAPYPSSRIISERVSLQQTTKHKSLTCFSLVNFQHLAQ